MSSRPPGCGSSAWGEVNGSGIAIFEGQNLTESHRHHSHMAGIYPFEKDVSFENLALSNGKRISGRRLNGVIQTHYEDNTEFVILN